LKITNFGFGGCHLYLVFFILLNVGGIEVSFLCFCFHRLRVQICACETEGIQILDFISLLGSVSFLCSTPGNIQLCLLQSQRQL